MNSRFRSTDERDRCRHANRRWFERHFDIQTGCIKVPVGATGMPRTFIGQVEQAITQDFSNLWISTRQLLKTDRLVRFLPGSKFTCNQFELPLNSVRQIGIREIVVR
jgi:hypothetical protein